jgi:hypothetical protein
MKVAAKRCAHCGCWFHPRPQSAWDQKFCGRPQCRRARKSRNLRSWRKRHPDKKYAAKVRAWAAAYPDYWRRYRKSHPEYARRDKERRSSSMKATRRSANETGWTSIAVEKLQAIEALRKSECSANETGWPRRVEAIEDYLLSTRARLCSANRNRLELSGSAAP